MKTNNLNIDHNLLKLVPYNVLANKEVILEEINKKLKAMRKGKPVPLRDI